MDTFLFFLLAYTSLDYILGFGTYLSNETSLEL